jgi:hypothetical protein
MEAIRRGRPAEQSELQAAASRRRVESHPAGSARSALIVVFLVFSVTLWRILIVFSVSFAPS